MSESLTAEALGRIDHDAMWREYQCDHDPTPWERVTPVRQAMHRAGAAAVAAAVLGAMEQRIAELQAEAGYTGAWDSGYRIGLAATRDVLDDLASEVAGG